MDLYSARLVFVCLIDTGKPRKRNLHDESTYVFKARDFDDALKRAVAIGRDQEVAYLNCSGQKVKWVFQEVDSLDRVGKKVDGMEVTSRMFYRIAKKPVSFRQKFHPEKSEPYQSI